MPRTIGSCIKTIVVADGLVSGRVFADDAPPGCTTPYVVIHDAIDLFPILKGDAETLRLERQAQVSLFDTISNEDKLDAARLFSALDGARIVLDSGEPLRLAVLSMPRIIEDSTNIVHRPLTLSVKHQPTAF